MSSSGIAASTDHIGRLAGPSAPFLLDQRDGDRPEDIRSALRTHGAALLRGVEQTIADFERLSDVLMTPIIHNSVAGGERDAVNQDRTTATVNRGSHPIPLHRDLSYAPGTPDLVVFYCESPSIAGGGETMLCDGATLLDRLPDDVKDFLRDRQLTWNWHAGPTRWRSVYGATPEEALQEIDALHRRSGTSGRLDVNFEGDTLAGRFTADLLTTAGEPARAVFCNSLLMTLPGYGVEERINRVGRGVGASASLGDGTAFPEPLLHTIAAEAEAITYELAWQHGDILVLDNTRYLNGRRAITDTGQRILTRVGHLRPAGRATWPGASAPDR